MSDPWWKKRNTRIVDLGKETRKLQSMKDQKRLNVVTEELKQRKIRLNRKGCLGTWKGWNTEMMNIQIQRHPTNFGDKFW